MLKKFQKIIFKYLKNMKTCAPTGATVIGCKCYRVQLVLGATVFHRIRYEESKYAKKVWKGSLQELIAHLRLF